jgi:hypothetical protein
MGILIDGNLIPRILRTLATAETAIAMIGPFAEAV